MQGPTTVTWEGTTIVEVRDARAGDDVVDGILSPGFIDAQVNGIGDHSVCDPSADLDAVARSLRAQGVTSWLPTIPTQSPAFYRGDYPRIVHKMDELDRSLPSAVGMHCEGPLLGRKPGAHDPSWFDAGEAIVDVLGTATMVTLAPEHPLGLEAARVLSHRGVVVAIGHSAPSSEEFDAGLATGISHVTHLFNAMSGVDHVTPGLAARVLTDDRLSFSVIADFVHVHPTVVALAYRAAGHRMTLVSDQVAKTQTSHKSVARLTGALVGLDAGVRNLVQGCDVPLNEALLMASTRPAGLLKLTDRGVLRVSARADLVLLTDDLVVHSVVCNGFSWRSDAH